MGENLPAGERAFYNTEKTRKVVQILQEADQERIVRFGLASRGQCGSDSNPRVYSPEE